jgi:phosphohistidine phosphatase
MTAEGAARALVILRHAKAERPTGVDDFDRPLTGRGHADAAAAGAWLAAQGLHPDLVMCSPARRTRQTWHGVAVALEQDSAPLVRYEPQAYEGGPAQLLAVLRTVDPALSTILLIGHNPTVSLLSERLAGTPVDSDGLRTAGLAVHQVTGGWTGLADGAAPLTASHTARSA